MLRIAAWMMLFIAQGGGTMEPTDRLVPEGWRGNPWGPTANAARESGELPLIELTPKMKEWDRWGRTAFQTGDVVFRQGDGRILFGWYPFSKFLASITGSAYSHTGIVVLEDGAPYIYDTTKAGVRRQPFAVWVLDNKTGIGVKRLKPEYRDRIGKVVAFVHKVYKDQIPFDYNLNPGDDELYCVEMTEKAFRAADCKLSDPVPIRDIERFHEFPITVAVLKITTRWVLDKPLTLDTPIFTPGNARHGIWASPALVTVYPTTPAATTTQSRGAR